MMCTDAEIDLYCNAHTLLAVVKLSLVVLIIVGLFCAAHRTTSTDCRFRHVSQL